MTCRAATLWREQNAAASPSSNDQCDVSAGRLTTMAQWRAERRRAGHATIADWSNGVVRVVRKIVLCERVRGRQSRVHRDLILSWTAALQEHLSKLWLSSPVESRGRM